MHQMSKYIYIKQILTDMKKEIDNNTIVGDFNNPLSKMHRSSRQNINKMVDLNYIVDQKDLIDIYRTFYRK